MICVVMRPFASDVAHKSGELVEVDGWRWTERLIEQRYLRVATASEAAKYSPIEAGEYTTPSPAKAAKPAKSAKAKTKR